MYLKLKLLNHLEYGLTEMDQNRNFLSSLMREYWVISIDSHKNLDTRKSMKCYGIFSDYQEPTYEVHVTICWVKIIVSFPSSEGHCANGNHIDLQRYGQSQFVVFPG